VSSDERDTGAPGGPTGSESVEPLVIDEIEVEDLAVDGICGVY
jgi:mycofactocin precursor